MGGPDTATRPSGTRQERVDLAPVYAVSKLPPLYSVESNPLDDVGISPMPLSLPLYQNYWQVDGSTNEPIASTNNGSEHVPLRMSRLCGYRIVLW